MPHSLLEYPSERLRLFQGQDTLMCLPGQRRAQGSVAGSLQAPQLKMSPSISVNLVEALLWINVLHKEKFGIFFLSLEKEEPAL